MASFPIDTKPQIIVVNILFQGKRSSKILKMVIDTGASITTIPSEIALAIGCNPSRPKRRIEMITASGLEYVPVVTIPEINLLGFKIKNIEAACLNLPPKVLFPALRPQCSL